MKIENTLSRLVAVIDAQERRPLAYSTDDCLMRLCESILTVLPDGVKRRKVEALRAQFEGKYATAEEGYALLRQAGHATPISLIRSLFRPIHISEAEDGDAAAKREGRHWTFGVIIGPYFYVTTSAGTGILPRSDAEKAYRVK